MFEGLVRQLILGYLGRYIKDIQKDQLKITLWNEEVFLENVELILDAFDYLRLPFAFKQGRVGKLSIKIPWKKLGWDPIIINLEDMHVIISKREDKDWSINAVEGRDYASKKAKLAAAELAKLSKRVSDNQSGKSFISYITAKILDGIQLSIRNVHVLFHETMHDEEEILFGLKLSSLTVMRQTAVGSSLPKLRVGQVNKSVEVRGLELYSETLAKAEISNIMSYMDPKKIWRGPKGGKYSSILSPLDVSVTLSVNRTGKLLNDAPQYNINAEIARLVTTIDEVQLLHILSLCDYLALGELREKYGCYRPWWSPVGKKLKGWQKAWWHYAQESVLSDVHRRLKKTSWKYFGQRLNARRKYVNLYKAKLKCLRYDEMIEECIQQELEQLEKRTDIDEILHYRSIAERELEDFLFDQSSRYVPTGERLKTTVEDDHTTGKLRGWLNWLSYGVLGAGGTNDTTQFSGVVSDDVIKDIYEATKFHPASDVIGDPVVDEVCFSSVKFEVSETYSEFRSNALGRAIAEIIFERISIESKCWDKTAIITASVNLSRIINPLNGQIVFFQEKVIPKPNVLKELHPSLDIKVDVSPPNNGFTTSVKAAVYSPEIFCDLGFFENLLDFFRALQHVNFQQHRILLSLNGIDDHNSRLLSKFEYVLSGRVKAMWDINISNMVINIPMGITDGCKEDNAVLEVTALMAKTYAEVDSFSYLTERSRLLTRCSDFETGCVGSAPNAFQLQDLYEHLLIQMSDAKMKFVRSSAWSLPVHAFSCSANVLSCIIPDEPTLKRVELYLEAPSLDVNFSSFDYREVMHLISKFSSLIPPSDISDSLEIKSNGLSVFLYPWISFSTRFNEIKLHVNLEDGKVDDCVLSLEVQNVGVWYDNKDSPDCWTSVETFQMTFGSSQGDQENRSLVAQMSSSESKQNVCINVHHQNRYFIDEYLIVDGCIVLHFEGISSKGMGQVLQKCSLSVKEVDIHCYPYVVGKLVGFVDRIIVCGASDIPDCGDEISSDPAFGVEEFSYSNGTVSHFSPSIRLEHLPLNKSENPSSISDVENRLDGMELQYSELFSLSERSEKLSTAFLHSSIYPEDVAENSDESHLLVILNLGRFTLHFHDSSCIICTVVVPLVDLVATISSDALDVFCSTKGLVLSTSWWCQIMNEFLWGPLSSIHSQVLDIHIRRRFISAHKTLLILSLHIQHVLCMLPPDFLAVLIGYFSLTDWGPSEQKQPVNLSLEDSVIIRYSIEIANCNLIVPACADFSELLKADIDHLRVFISQSAGSDMTRDIPSDCYIFAQEFSDLTLGLDLLGCEGSISLLVLEKEVVDPSNGCQNFVLIPSLCADVWLRIPCETAHNISSSCPVCVMASVKECQLDIDVASAISGLKALLYIIEQFSLVDKESKIFSNNLLHFLDVKRTLVEYAEPPSTTSSVILTEMKFCLQSLLLRFRKLNDASPYSQLLAESEMRLLLTISLTDDRLQCLNISFSSLTIISFLNSVMLAEFVGPRLGSPVLEVILSLSESGEIRILLSCSSSNIWLHLFDWYEVICLLSSFPEQFSEPNADANGVHAASSFSLILEDISLNLHFPALGKVDSLSELPELSKLSCGDLSKITNSDQNSFISLKLRCRNSELVADGKIAKLRIIFENLNGTLKLLGTDLVQTWPLFQLSKTFIDAEILNDERLNMNLLVQCDGLHFSLSNHMKYVIQFRWFDESEGTPSQYSFKEIEIKVHLQKLSVLLTDCKWTSNGPLLEILLRNMVFYANVMEYKLEGSVISDLKVNYYSIDKVLWEPLLEPCKIQLSMKREQYESSLLDSGFFTDINLESKTSINFNINESVIEVVIRTIEMVKDALETRNFDIARNLISKNSETRYAPYTLQNLTTLPLVFNVCQQQLGAEDLDVSPSTGILDAGSSALIYINESPDELLFRYKPIQSFDKLNDKKFLEIAHRYVTFQLDGASSPSPPISMDLSSFRYFEADFFTSSHISVVHGNGTHVKMGKKVESNVDMDGNNGFSVPVVIDVSVQRFTKLIRLYSTVVILNATSILLEVRLDVPFGLSSKVLGPIYPGQEFPLPLHLATVGYIRWRPLSDSHLWSEAYSISSIISRDIKIGFFRSFVCYPSRPSNDAFRCCISVNEQCLANAADADKQSQSSQYLSSNISNYPGNRFLYQVVLTSPLVFKNYLMRPICVTFEVAGFACTANLSEVEASFYQIDSSSDLLITFKMHGFRPSYLKYLRAESFSEKAKFSGTKFSISEIVKFDSDCSDGSLYVTMEKVMDAVSGAREILISVPFLLYNCSGFPLILSNSVNEMKAHSCTMPSCYDLDEQKAVFEKKDGLGVILADKTLPDSAIEENLKSPNAVSSCHRKVAACLFSPDPSSYSGEVMVAVSRYAPSVVESASKLSWSSPFSLVAPTGSTSILLSQLSTASGYVLSVSAVASPISGRTKFITFQPRYVITNACTKTLCYKQKGTNLPFTLGAGCHSHIHWMDMNRELMLCVRFDEPGWEWSGSFLPEQLGDTQVKLRNYVKSSLLMIRVEVRSADVATDGEKIVESTSGNSGINLIILSVDNTGFMPYRIDNHSRERLRIYQPKCESFETLVHPYTSSRYAWDEPCNPHRLVIEVPSERVLGSYALDDVPAESLVHLPATSEKPERNLVVTIHSEGVIKVISVIDSSHHDVNGGKGVHAPLQLNYREKQDKCEVLRYKERISLDIPFLGVSLMNTHPEELLYVSAKNMKLNFVQDLDQQFFSLLIASFQIDNQLRATPYPVLLSFKHSNNGNRVLRMRVKENSAKLLRSTGFTGLNEPVFSVVVSLWRNTDESLVSFESVSLSMEDVFLEIEQEIVLKLFEFGKTASLRLESNSFQHMYSSESLFCDLEGRTAGSTDSAGKVQRSYPSDATILHGEVYKKSCLLPNIVPIGAPWQKIHIDERKDRKLYVEQFEIEPITLTLSFSSTPWILRNGVLTSGESLIHRGLMALADVEGAKIHFRLFTLSHKIASLESIQEILAGHYSRLFVQEMYKVFGSAGVIGNPVGFARSLGLGIRDFFSLPAWSVIQSPTGLITGMAQGTTNLLSNTIYAISDATSQFTKAAHKGIVAFTLDEQTASMIERQQKGMRSHSKGVINEFLEGLTGVLQSPIQGAEKHGLPGVLSGVAVGVAGLMAKPAASILEVTGKTAQSIKNRSRIHQTGYRSFRIRLPRPLSADSPLRPYSWEEAIGTCVLNESDPKLRGEVLVICKALKQNGQYALITGGVVLVVSCSSFVDLGMPDFEGVPADPKFVIQTEIKMGSIILANHEGELVHIVGSDNNAASTTQNNLPQQQQKKKQGTIWGHINSSLPIYHTILEFPVQEDATDFLGTLLCTMEREKEQAWSSVHILQRCNIK